jgi:hypothetical protein
MQVDATELGLVFYKLVQVKDSKLRKDVECYDGSNTALLENYVLEIDNNYEYVQGRQLGAVELVRANCLAVIGNANEEIRCYEKTITAYKDNYGDLWMDAELHDDVFC